MKNFILVTDWERVQKDDFYLSKEWKADNKKAKVLQKEGHLYVAYIVEALNYCIYTQMDAEQVFINEDMDIVLTCESAVIGNNHDKRIEYNY